MTEICSNCIERLLDEFGTEAFYRREIGNIGDPPTGDDEGRSPYLEDALKKHHILEQLTDGEIVALYQQFNLDCHFGDLSDDYSYSACERIVYETGFVPEYINQIRLITDREFKKKMAAGEDISKYNHPATVYEQWDAYYGKKDWNDYTWMLNYYFERITDPKLLLRSMRNLANKCMKKGRKA